MEKLNAGIRGYFEDWYLDLAPSTLMFHNTKTGKHLEEPSLVAVKLKRTAETAPRAAFEQILAVGRAALEYKGAPDAAVFSPFRQGQIAHYGAAEHLIKVLLKQVTRFPLPKPPLCIHIQPQTTEVEERALIDAGIQAGAQKVFLYQESFSILLEHIHESGVPNGAIILHIEPQDEPIPRKR